MTANYSAVLAVLEYLALSVTAKRDGMQDNASSIHLDACRAAKDAVHPGSDLGSALITLAAAADPAKDGDVLKSPLASHFHAALSSAARVVLAAAIEGNQGAGSRAAGDSRTAAAALPTELRDAIGVVLEDATGGVKA